MMLKKLFGKKSKKENQAPSILSQQENLNMQPLNCLQDFYHNGRAPFVFDPSFSNPNYRQTFPTPHALWYANEATAGHPSFQAFFPDAHLGMTASLRNTHTACHFSNTDHFGFSDLPEQENVLPSSPRVIYVENRYEDKNLYIPPMDIERSDLHDTEDRHTEYHDESGENNTEQMDFQTRLKHLENTEIYGVRVNGQNYGYHFGFHDPNCEIPAYQKEKVQMNHVKIGEMKDQIIALHIWNDAKDAETLQQVQTIYVRIDRIDALILYANQDTFDLQDTKNEGWHLQLIQDQKKRTFKLHTLNETYLLKEIHCESDIFGKIRVDYKVIGVGTDDFILAYQFEQKQSGETARIYKEKLKIYIPVDKVVSLETKV